MGQNQSTHAQYKQRGQTIPGGSVDYEEAGLHIDNKILLPEEPEPVLRRVHDDGGDGYVPAETAPLGSISSLTVPVVFRWEYGGKEVYLSGSFNDWKTRVPMTYCGGEFTAIIELPSGKHHFKYLVDGNWIHDPSQKTEDDAFGGRNNVIDVNDSDFDATEALLKDEGPKKNFDGSSNTSSTGRESPPGSYSQQIPSLNDPLVAYDTIGAAVPPSLPPHLLHVILNQDNIINQDDPTQLPIPHHVGLNHLYALSIKDNVMALSGSHRYRRKYVTTIFYKPVKVN